jgi:flagellar protein FlgJ
MSGIGPVTPAPTPAPRVGEEKRLHQAVKQLEGVFVEQLFKAMRQTVPKDGLTDGGAGEEMFSGLFDQAVAEKAPAQWKHGVGEALYQQLRQRLASPNETPIPAEQNKRT